MKRSPHGFGIVAIFIVIAAVSVLSVTLYSVFDKQSGSNQAITQEKSSDNTEIDELETEDRPEVSEQNAIDSASDTSTESSESSAQQDTVTPPSTENMKSFTVIYNILADGKTAKIAPTNAIIKADTVKLLVDLNCESSCQFKLASDTHPLVNGKTYTSSQTIEYTLDKPGEWLFFNEYIPRYKFKISF